MSLIAATGTDFLDLHSSVKFVAGAYIFVFAVIALYLGIMAKRLIANQRELVELRKLVEDRDAAEAVSGATGVGPAPGTVASSAVADEHERAAEAIRSEHQL